MTFIEFTQVDAFSDRPFSGNPAAVMPLDTWLDDDVLQAIAAENNLSETAFIVSASGDAGHELRWFTPTTEVALCGHATLAAGHVLLTANPAHDTVRFQTRTSGIIEVRRVGQQRYELDLPAWPASPKLLANITAAMGGLPVETRWREGGYALVIYRDEKAIRALRPDMTALKKMDNLLFIATAPGDKTEVVSRVFAPGAGIDEDPVTGAAHCVLVPYWAERLKRDSFKAYQASERGGQLDCRIDGDRVILGGSCVTIIEGRFIL